MSNLEYSFIVKELSSLLGKHFSKIRKMNEDTYRMKIGNIEILCQLGVRIHKTKYIEEPEPHDKFVQKLEKELVNAKLLSIEQLNNDRIISFNFDKGNLVFEMFGKGNIILLKDEKIICAYKNEKWADREIKVGLGYSPPKKPSDEIEVSDRYIIVSLTKLPLGKEYALEVLARLGIDEKTPGNKLNTEQLSKLEKEIEKIKKSCQPCMFIQDGRPFDFSLTELSSYSTHESKKFQSLSEAIDEFYYAREAPNEQLEKLKKRLEKQKERLESLKGEEKENRQKGDLIYENYSKVEESIKAAKADKIKNLNKKEKSVETDL